jgi:hypothetical protein
MTFVMIIIRDNMKVYRTDDLEDTLDFLERIYNKLNDQGKELFEKDDTSLAVQYSSTIKTKKKENMTPAVCYTLQLAQIPGNYSSLHCLFIFIVKVLAHRLRL